MSGYIDLYDAVELLGHSGGLAFESILFTLDSTPVLALFVGVFVRLGEIVFLGNLELEQTRCTVLLVAGELALALVLDVYENSGSLFDGVVAQFGDSILAGGDAVLKGL